MTRWVASGPAPVNMKAGGCKEKIWNFLVGAGPLGATTAQVAAATGIKETVVGSTISADLKKNGHVTKGVNARRPRRPAGGYNRTRRPGGGSYVPPKSPPPPPPPAPKIRVDDTKAAMLLALQNHIAARHANKEDVAKTFDRFRAFAAHVVSPTANANEAENAEVMLVKQIIDLYRRA